MKKNVDVFLKHILESIDRIEEFTKEVSKEHFLDSVQLQDAVIRRIEVIGEASKNVPSDFRKRHEEIPWNEMVRTRDKLIHGYFGIDLDLTWDIIKYDLPALKKKIRKLSEEVEGGEKTP